jgi:hypothetical protein
MFRYCILSTPRTGSTWLADGIGYPYRLLKNYIHLGEFFTPFVDEWVGYEITENNMIKKIWGHLPFQIDGVKEFKDSRLKILLAGDIKQPIVLKYMYWPTIIDDHLDTIANLKKIQDHNIKIINLNRNDTFACVISQLTAQYTGLAHRRRGLLNKDTWSTTSGFRDNIDTSTMTKIEINLTEFEIYYSTYLTAIKEKQQISDSLECITVNYESLLTDCINNKIPFQVVANHKKLYDVGYNDIIKNYDQLLDIKNKIDAGNE